MKKAFWVLLILTGIALIGASVLSIMASTQLTVGNLFPGAAGIVLAAYGILRLARRGKPVFGNRALRIAVTVVVCIGVASFIAVEGLIIGYAAADEPEQPVNFVVVPGAGVFPDGRLTLTLQNRLDKAAVYLREHPDVICIVSGGQGSNEPVTEADAMREYLMDIGIDEKRIETEPLAVSTFENMQFSAAIMAERYPGLERTAVVVTSDFHVYRALLYAREAGIDAGGIGTPTPWRVVVANYMREYLAVVNTWLFRVEI